jgi:hypothetical protein
LAENLFLFFSVIAGGYDRRTEKKEVGHFKKNKTQNTRTFCGGKVELYEV